MYPFTNPSNAISGGMNPYDSSSGSGLLGPGGSQWGGALGSGLGAGLMALFGNNFKNPANSAMPYLNQIPGAMSQYLQPYMQGGGQGLQMLLGQLGMGQNALPALMGQYGNLLSNPGGMVNQIGQSFHQSPGYQFQVDQSLNAANRSAAAGGMAGSPMEQQNIAGTVNQLANQDYYNYLGNAENMYGQGLQGLQGVYGQEMGGLNSLTGMGLNASGDMATNLAQALMSQANLAYAGQANQNQNQQGMWGDIAGMLPGLAGMLPGLVGAAASFI